MKEGDEDLGVEESEQRSQKSFVETLDGKPVDKSINEGDNVKDTSEVLKKENILTETNASDVASDPKDDAAAPHAANGELVLLTKNQVYNSTTAAVSNTSRSDDPCVIEKNRNECTSGTKPTTTSLTNGKATSSTSLSSKGYSAVTKASMNRAKTSVIIATGAPANCNILNTGLCGRANVTTRGTNSNVNVLSGKGSGFGQNGKIAPSIGTIMDKSMTSSTSSSSAGMDVSMSISQTSSILGDKSISSSGSSAKTSSGTYSSTTTKKISSSGKSASTSSGGTVNANSGSIGPSGDRSPKTQRVSLVQRQARFAASVSAASTDTTNSTRAQITRSATTPSLSSRGRGIGSNRGSNTRRQTARPMSSRYTASCGRSTSTANRSHPSIKSTNSVPLTNPPPNSRTQSQGLNSNSTNVHPFGSTSSISSSSSSRSWADTVKRLKAVSNVPPIAAKSVENLSGKNANVSSSLHYQDEEGSAISIQDEGGEWETVKPRTRSRLSPITSQVGKSRIIAPTSAVKGGQELKRSSSFTGDKTESSKCTYLS